MKNDSELCGCEHTNHFNDHFGPQTKHDYASVLADGIVVPWVGAVCDDCATTCMRPYVEKVK